MKRAPRRPARSKSAGEATRRQFLTTVALGAAYTACGDKAVNGTGGAANGGSTGAGGGDNGSKRDARAPEGRAGGSGGASHPGSGNPGMGSQGPAPTTDAAANPNPAPDASARVEVSGPAEAKPDAAPEVVARGKSASDQVMLGKTGIRVSRLALGSGTHGSGGTSEQTRLGVPAFSRFLVQSLAEQGLNFWETADGYGSHPHVKEAIRQVGRDKVVVLTKSKANTAAEMQADLDRFRRELGVEQIDVVLLHAITDSNWTQNYAGAMEALSRAKESGVIRAHGTSCHSLGALRLAARTPWVEVDLARINAARIEMDSDPATVISVLREMRAAGKGVVGMKILGVGALARTLDSAIAHAVKLDAIDAFTIGFTSQTQLQQVTTKIAQVAV